MFLEIVNNCLLLLKAIAYFMTRTRIPFLLKLARVTGFEPVPAVLGCHYTKPIIADKTGVEPA
jgi:hypothetical protein